MRVQLPHRNKIAMTVVALCAGIGTATAASQAAPKVKQKGKTVVGTNGASHTTGVTVIGSPGGSSVTNPPATGGNGQSATGTAGSASSSGATRTRRATRGR